jgi:hypothetical protein
MNRPYLGDVSFREVLSYDLTSFFVGILLLFVMACVTLIIVSVSWFGVAPPRESPGEILIGLLAIAFVVAAVLRFRASRITKTLRSGEIIVAKVLRGIHCQNFVQIFVRYSVGGEVIQKRLWLPDTKHPRALIENDRIFLSVRVGKPRKAVVRNLYMQ